MNSSKITRLEEEQIKAFQETLSKLQQWESFKSDYETLEERLKTLPDKVTHQVMVPFGPMAFMPGQLIHTNEITVLLGDNWFVERSATQACGIAQRRIEHVQKVIKDLQKQKELLEARLGFTADFKAESSNMSGLVDIREEYDEEKEAKWREERKKKQIATKPNLTAERRKSEKQQSPAETSKTDEKPNKGKEQNSDEEEKTRKQKRMEEMEAALLARLDALEKQEEEFDELAMMSDFDENEMDDDDSDSDDEDEESDNPAYGTKNKSVQWKDKSDNSVNKITFQHSSSSKTEIPETSESEMIQSPRDIYKLVQSSPDKGKSSGAVKSILKKQSSYGKLETKEDVKESPPRQPKPAPTSVFTGSVVERKPETKNMTAQDSTDQPQKRVSKFKAARQGKR
ncbi:uncharacterized protein [Antedon mediterranea]|uniref:uncharacterized protein n=1 Tax=Antedon mediterranea TaxID=105859 RepID=UPI003AF53AFE